MFGRGIRIGRIFGISIEIDFSWFVIFFLVAYSLSKGYFPHYYPDIATTHYWVMGVLAALLLFASVLLHELSHSIIALRNKLPISRITLFIFGGVANMEEEPKSPGVEFRVAAAGPACSLMLMIVFWALSLAMTEGSAPYAIMQYVSYINGFLALFNLIPGFPLDGGRLLRATLWHFRHNFKSATRIASNMGKGFAAFLMFMGFLNVMTGNPFNGIWFILIGYFLQRAAESSYRQVVIKEMLSGLTVEKVMNRGVVSVSEGLSIRELVHDFFIAHHFNCFPVAEGETLKGIIRMSNVKEIPKEQWDTLSVREVMEANPARYLVAPASGVEEAFGKMLKEDTGWLVVADEKGCIVGVMTRGDIIHLMEIKSGLGE